MFSLREVCFKAMLANWLPLIYGIHWMKLFPLLWETTRILEGLGLKLRSWICDGAIPN